MAQPENRFRFDPTINLGHVLTIVSFVVIAMMQWNVMDKRIVILEEFRTAQRERDVAQDVVAKDKFQEVRDALLDLRRSIEKVADKVGVK
jgi:hypothetical protein